MAAHVVSLFMIKVTKCPPDSTHHVEPRTWQLVFHDLQFHIFSLPLRVRRRNCRSYIVPGVSSPRKLLVSHSRRYKANEQTIRTLKGSIYTLASTLRAYKTTMFVFGDRVILIGLGQGVVRYFFLQTCAWSIGLCSPWRVFHVADYRRSYFSVVGHFVVIRLRRNWYSIIEQLLCDEFKLNGKCST